MEIIRWSCGSGAGTISHQTPGSNALAPNFQLECRLCLGPEVINMLFWMYFGSRFSLVIERLGRTRSGVSEVSFILFPPLNKPSASYNLGLHIIRDSAYLHLASLALRGTWGFRR